MDTPRSERAERFRTAIAGFIEARREELQPLRISAIQLAGTTVINTLRHAAPNPVRSFFSGRHDSTRKVALDG